MSDDESQQVAELVRQLVHDLLGNLHAISMGVAILREVRLDESQFAATCTSIENEHREAATRADELRAAVRRMLK